MKPTKRKGQRDALKVRRLPVTLTSDIRRVITRFFDPGGEARIRNIVDRIGAGDSFAGALIFALNTDALSQPATALCYAVAASCLKHSIKGDFNYVSRSEIESLMHGSGSGRVQR